MKTDAILDGIESSQCRDELTAHMDLVWVALELEECDFDYVDLGIISDLAARKVAEFDCRILQKAMF